MTTEVLAIDDSLTIRELVKAVLGSAGFTVSTAEDGADGLKRFEGKRFDTVITDINMPNLDGFGVIEGIRGGNHNRRVPIIVLTTESGPELRARARDAGATAWIVKPFKKDQLIDMCRQVTRGA